jgi:hypothetical protein
MVNSVMTSIAGLRSLRVTMLSFGIAGSVWAQTATEGSGDVPAPADVGTDAEITASQPTLANRQGMIVMYQTAMGNPEPGTLPVSPAGLDPAQNDPAEVAPAVAPREIPAGSPEILRFGHDRKSGPLPGYPMLWARPDDGGKLLRTGPGLLMAMTAIQRDDQPGAVEALRTTVSQLDSAKANLRRAREGKQCAATRKALAVGEQTLAAHTAPAGGATGMSCDSDFANAVSSAQRVASPILLDLNGNGIADVTSPHVTDSSGAFVEAGSTWFDVSGRGEGRRTEWLKAGQDGLLALDANGNGIVDSATELFGDADGFADGYAKLALLDRNGDGRLTGEELGRLAVWIDRDGDGVCLSAELVPVGALHVTDISVQHEKYVSSYVRDGQRFRTWDWFPRAE